MAYGISFSIQLDMFAKYYDLELESEELKTIYDTEVFKIKSIFEKNGFENKSGLFFISKSTNAVNSVLIFQKLISVFPWISTCISCASLYRIAESMSLHPLINKKNILY